MARISGAICHIITHLGKILDKQPDRQPALHFKLAVDALTRFLQHFAGEIGGDQLDPPSGGDHAFHLFQRHGQRIRLLTGRRRGAPNTHAARDPARGQKLRQDRRTKGFERSFVAKKERFVCGHRLDDLGHEQVVGVLSERGYESLKAAETGFASDREEPALDQVLLVAAQHEAGALLEPPAQEIVVERRHARTPQNR